MKQARIFGVSQHSQRRFYQRCLQKLRNILKSSTVNVFNFTTLLQQRKELIALHGITNQIFIIKLQTKFIGNGSNTQYYGSEHG